MSERYPSRAKRLDRARPGVLAWVVPAWVAMLVALVMPGSAAFGQTQATELPLLYPWAIAFDAQGNLYFSETAAHVVRMVTPQGVVTTVAGTGTQGFSGDGGPATMAELDSPAGLAVSAAGDLYIADRHNQRIRRVSGSSGTITTIAGSGSTGFAGDNGVATAAALSMPTALAVDAAGAVYIADSGNHRIRKVSASGMITTVAGNGVQGFAGDGGQATAAELDSPGGLGLDPAGNLYLADTHNGRVRRVAASSGVITTLAGTAVPGGGLAGASGDGGPATAATLALPRGVTVDAAGNLYVADSANHRVRRIAVDGTIGTVAGQGTEAFAGDGAPAVAASLDAPRSVALSPAGLLTLADTGNARVRQLDALPAPGPDIHTLSGVGAVATGGLSLNAPSVVVYGSGSVTATLAAASGASGSVTLVDSAGTSAVPVGTALLQGDLASFSLGLLGAGVHLLTATYAGDGTHLAAQSPTVAVTVTPLAVEAVPVPAGMLYGQPVPGLGGSLRGVLAQDAGKVSVVFGTSAGQLSPVGAYPISAVLTGTSAGNYLVEVDAAVLTVAQAPTVTTVAVSNNLVSVRTPVTFAVQTASTTSGTPTGTVALLDGGTTLETAALSAAGNAAWTISSLGTGSHSLTAVYRGDANFVGSSSAVAAVSVGAAADFTLAATGATTQSIPSGSSATYTFAVQMQGGAIPGAIQLSVQGLPLGATSSMNPATLPPGGGNTSFSMTVTTAKLARLVPEKPESPYRRLWPVELGLTLLPLSAIKRGRRAPLSCQTHPTSGARQRPVRGTIGRWMCFLALSTILEGCGNRVNTAPELSSAASYTLTISGSATSSSGTLLQHSVNVVLQVL